MLGHRPRRVVVLAPHHTQHSVGSDSGVSVAQPPGQLGRQIDGAVEIRQQYEVVLRPVSLDDVRNLSVP